ncbi:MAG: hypothetical protein LBS64_05185 [Spirochaetaceae bacterium]|jgi:hypothetical protein|nr:hypothetical protein [Spirochaetaceae bacterium]
MPNFQLKKTAGFFLAAALCIPGVFSGGSRDIEPAWYVRANGSDTNTGLSSRSPFKTLARALEAAKTSDTLLILVMEELTDRSEENSRDRESVFHIAETGNRAITIRGASDKARLSAARTNKRVLRIARDAEIRLENIEITGGQSVIGGGILAEQNAVLTVAAGTRIRENQAETGGGIAFTGHGILILEDGDISENRATAGGGIFFSSLVDGGVSGRFLMTGGRVANNKAEELGGGIMLADSPTDPAGEFRLNGGTISGNTASGGGGVLFFCRDKTATRLAISETKIMSNTAVYGGGILLNNGSFVITGGLIWNNHADAEGGGISYDSGAVSELNGGVILNNRSDGMGGGMVVKQGTVTLSGGFIGGSSAKRGGGVDILYNAVFTCQGGQIAGSESVETPNRADGMGDAAFKENGTLHLRNTAVPETEMFSSVNFAGWN